MRILPLLVLAALAACNSSNPKASPDPQVVASGQTSAATIDAAAAPAEPTTAALASASASAQPRAAVAMPASAAKLARGSNALGFDLWKKMPTSGDAAMSPTSISVALAMAVAGAKGTTATQLASTMHLDGADPTAWGDIAAALENRGAELAIANRFYAEKTLSFDPAYVRTTATSFRAPLDAVDFKNDSTRVRTQINGWVSGQTKNRIDNLLPEGSLTRDTRLTLVNAIYLLADWDVAFEKSATYDQAFSLAPGKTRSTPMMHRTGGLRSAAVDGARVVDLPYKGSSLSMTLIVPDKVDGLGAIEKTLSNDVLAKVDKALSTQRTEVTLPKFTIDPSTSLSLADALRALGATAAFDRQTAGLLGDREPGHERRAARALRCRAQGVREGRREGDGGRRRHGRDRGRHRGGRRRGAALRGESRPAVSLPAPRQDHRPGSLHGARRRSQGNLTGGCPRGGGTVTKRYHAWRPVLTTGASTVRIYAKSRTAAGGIAVASPPVMTSVDGASTTEIECVWTDHDIDTTVNVGPETHRRILAAAFPMTADDEPTVRMAAPFASAGMPSPLGDEEEAA